MGSVMCGRRGAVGSATAENVLAGKTFSSDKGVNIAGTMPDRGEYQYANGSGGGSGYYAFNGIPEGYYHSDGHDWAPEIRISAEDAKNSQMWSDAYSAGYANGVTNEKSVNAIGGCLAMAWWNDAISNSNPSSHVSWVDDTTQTLPPGTYIWAVGQESAYGNNDGCWIEVNGSRIAYVNTKGNNSQSQCGSYTLTSSANVRCRAGNYNGRGFAAFVRIG